MSTTEAPIAPVDEADTADEPDTTSKKGKSKKDKKKRSNVVPAVILAVGLIVGGYLMKPSAPASAVEEEAVEEEILPGELVALDAMTLNLSDGHYLRLGVAVELVEGVPAAEWSEHGEPNRYKDLIIARVGELPSEQFATAAGRDELKELLRTGAHELFEEEFSEVYLTELVVQ